MYVCMSMSVCLHHACMHRNVLFTSHRTVLWWERWRQGPGAGSAGCDQNPGSVGPAVAEHPPPEAAAACGPPVEIAAPRQTHFLPAMT